MAERAVFLTRDGLRRFEQELEQLRTVRRPQVAERIRQAKEFTDALDNAEYDDAKSEQGFIEGRIQQLEGALARAQIIGEGPRSDVVEPGSRVTVKDTDGIQEEYVIVGSVEAEPRRGLISNESPIGRALLGRRAGDRVSVTAPGGSFELTVVEVA